MKFTSKLLTLAIALAILATASVAALAEYGSGAVTQGQTYTTEQMLTYAIEDEYMAQAEYQAIIDKFGVSRPFSNHIDAEQQHIDYLKTLMTQYGIEIPENDAASRVVLPDTLAEAYDVGAAAENNNIAMYDAFLNQDLPVDVKDIFTSLKSASQNHLEAFQQNVNRNGNARMGNQTGSSNSYGRGNGNASSSTNNASGNGRSNNKGNRANGRNNNQDNNACGNCPYDD